MAMRNSGESEFRATRRETPRLVDPIGSANDEAVPSQLGATLLELVLAVAAFAGMVGAILAALRVFG